METEPSPSKWFWHSASFPPCVYSGIVFFSAQELTSVGTCGIPDCTVWVSSFQSSHPEAHTSHKAKAQGLCCAFARSDEGAFDYQVTKSSLISSLPLYHVRALNESRQLICHLELMHFCPFTNSSHLCPGINVKCNNCIADFKKKQSRLIYECLLWTLNWENR